jgi:hypothetical protein
MPDLSLAPLCDTPHPWWWWAAALLCMVTCLCWTLSEAGRKVGKVGCKRSLSLEEYMAVLSTLTRLHGARPPAAWDTARRRFELCMAHLSGHRRSRYHRLFGARNSTWYRTQAHEYQLQEQQQQYELRTQQNEPTPCAVDSSNNCVWRALLSARPRLAHRIRDVQAYLHYDNDRPVEAFDLHAIASRLDLHIHVVEHNKAAYTVYGAQTAAAAGSVWLWKSERGDHVTWQQGAMPKEGAAKRLDFFNRSTLWDSYGMDVSDEGADDVGASRQVLTWAVFLGCSYIVDVYDMKI